MDGKYSQKLLDHAKQSTAYALKTNSKRETQETAEATGDLIINKLADNITKFYKNLQQNDSETVTNEKIEEIVEERYISPQERQKVIADLRSI